jgi:CO/xanthine dehydrogenase FAD-binding subunit
LLFDGAGSRTLPADQFFLGPLTMALQPDEILTDCFPPAGDPAGSV